MHDVEVYVSTVTSSERVAKHPRRIYRSTSYSRGFVQNLADIFFQSCLQVPTLSEKGVKGAYSLEIHSDHAVEVSEASKIREEKKGVTNYTVGVKDNLTRAPMASRVVPPGSRCPSYSGALATGKRSSHRNL